MLEQHRKTLSELRNRPRPKWDYGDADSFKPKLDLDNRSSLITIVDSVKNESLKNKSQNIEKDILVKKSVKFKKSVLKKIEDIKEGRGLGTKITSLILRSEKNDKIFKEQARQIQIQIDEFNRKLDLCLKQEISEEELRKVSVKIVTIYRLLKWDSYLKETYLSPKELSALEIAIRMHSR